jgi:hypothetical protein
MQEMLVFQGALIPLKYENCYLARSVRQDLECQFFRLFSKEEELRFGLVLVNWA